MYKFNFSIKGRNLIYSKTNIGAFKLSDSSSKEEKEEIIMQPYLINHG